MHSFISLADTIIVQIVRFPLFCYCSAGAALKPPVKTLQPPDKKKFESDVTEISTRIRDLETQRVSCSSSLSPPPCSSSLSPPPCLLLPVSPSFLLPSPPSPILSSPFPLLLPYISLFDDMHNFTLEK